LAAQTYPRLEVLVIDDGSREPESVAVFEELRDRYPRFRFSCQARAGAAATRNRSLFEARGTYFIPMDADHLACPDMVQRLVARVRANPRLSAVTCYLLTLQAPAGLKNVHGPALFHTADFRAVGGYDTGPDVPGQEWSGFFKLVNAGRQVDILPEHLFRTNVSEGGESGGPQSFFLLDRALAAERVALWTALGRHERRVQELAGENEALRARLGLLRYRIADRLDALCGQVPFVRSALKRLVRLFSRERPPSARE